MSYEKVRLSSGLVWAELCEQLSDEGSLHEDVDEMVEDPADLETFTHHESSVNSLQEIEGLSNMYFDP